MSRLNVQPRTKRERKIRDTKKGENEYMGDLTRSLKRAEEKTLPNNMGLDGTSEMSVCIFCLPCAFIVSTKASLEVIFVGTVRHLGSVGSLKIHNCN